MAAPAPMLGFAGRAPLTTHVVMSDRIEIGSMVSPAFGASIAAQLAEDG